MPRFPRPPLVSPSAPAALLFGLVTVGSLAGCKYGRVQVPEGAEQRWSEMDENARHAHMESVVLPRMKAVFQAFDAERYADFNCVTCHGRGAADGSYAMPSPDLPTLQHAGIYKKHRKETPEVAEFMWKEVQSNLGQALGETWGPAGAVDCKSCHVVVD